MNIQKYLAFIKVVELGSFTKASEALGYTQSGISRMIHDLEVDWGISLLERGRTGIRLTSDGLKILPQVKRICDEQSFLTRQVEDLLDMQTGMIRIGTISSVANHWLPNMVRKFKEEYPKIDFEFLLGDYTEIESWIANGRVDFGFVRLPTRREFETIFVEQDQLLIVLPLEHPCAGIERFPMKEIENNSFMLLEKGAKAEVSELLEKHTLSPQINFTTWDDYAVMSMVENGLGISILPELILKRIPHKIIAKELEVPAFRKIGVAMRDHESLSLASKRFLDYLPFLNKLE